MHPSTTILVVVIFLFCGAMIDSAIRSQWEQKLESGRQAELKRVCDNLNGQSAWADNVLVCVVQK